MMHSPCEWTNRCHYYLLLFHHARYCGIWRLIKSAESRYWLRCWEKVSILLNISSALQHVQHSPVLAARCAYVRGWDIPRGSPSMEKPLEEAIWNKICTGVFLKEQFWFCCFVFGRWAVDVQSMACGAWRNSDHCKNTCISWGRTALCIRQDKINSVDVK